MWTIIMILLAVCAVSALAYLVTRFHRFSLFQRVGEKRKWLSWLLAIAPVAAIGGVFCAINVTTMIVVLLHLLVAWALCDLIGWIVKRVGKRRVSRDITGVAAIALTVVYLGVGWFMAHHVFETHYQLTTDKSLGGEPLRLAMFADSHLGITLDGDSFSRAMARVQAAQPDAVLLVGDFVDDESTAEDMRAACAALGRLETTYGVFFVYGNHDEGYFNYRNFSGDELRAALAENGVTILADEVFDLAGRALLVGRNDRTDHRRQSIQALSAGLDPDKYAIVLDHQPNDYANESACPVDLVLSGHTHGGHMFPAGQIGLLIGANDAIYGRHTLNGTDFIVTSGISGWAIPFKTGTFSEITIIDIVEE